MTSPETPTDRPVSRPWLGSATPIAAAAAVVALLAAAWFGFGWTRAAFFTDVPRAHAREAVLDGARQAAINLNSMNPDDVDGSMKLMQSSMTGQMLADYKTNSQQIKQAAVAGKTKLVAKVIGASVTELNSERDHAKVLVVLLQSATEEGKGASTQRVTWLMDMTKADDSWKAQDASSLGNPVLVDNGPAAPPANQATPEPSAQPQPPKSGN